MSTKQLPNFRLYGGCVYRKQERSGQHAIYQKEWRMDRSTEYLVFKVPVREVSPILAKSEEYRNFTHYEAFPQDGEWLTCDGRTFKRWKEAYQCFKKRIDKH